RMCAFIEAIDAHIETFGNLLRYSRVEIMRALRFRDGVLANGGFVSCAVELRDRALFDIFQRRWCEIARVTSVQRGPFKWLIDGVDPRTELVLVRKCVHDVEAAAEIDCQLFERFIFILQIESVEIAVLA